MSGAGREVAGVRFDPTAPLLRVRDLRVDFRSRQGTAHAVNGVSLDLEAGRTLGLVGESGCGKSVTAQAIMGILDTPPARVAAGEVLLHGVDLLGLDDDQRRVVRANRIGMVFQDALTALNPVFTVGWQLAELFRKHRGTSRSDARKEAVRLLDTVGIPGARDRAGDYPHQFSGGMRQRVMIAMGLALEPDLLIADEPTTALDVTVQAQILRLLCEVQRDRGMGLILITHDMGVVAEVADDVSVMYAGRIVESADVASVYDNPAHPYTKALLESVPRLDRRGTTLAAIEGLPPPLTRLPRGCSFHPRCGFRRDGCATDEPPLYEVGRGRGSACHYYDQVLRS